jgi:hypothetical protein
MAALATLKYDRLYHFMGINQLPAMPNASSLARRDDKRRFPEFAACCGGTPAPVKVAIEGADLVDAVPRASN